MNFLFIINPISGDEDKTHLLKKVKNQLNRAHQLSVYKTTGNNDLEKIQEKIEENKFDRVLVAGGDGTVKLAAEY